MAVMRLAGHKSGLDYKSYFRPNEDFILSQYELAIDALTIDPIKRMARKIQTMEVERSQFDN